MRFLFAAIRNNIKEDLCIKSPNNIDKLLNIRKRNELNDITGNF